jgi:3-isopropylmalate/(R)-2-methylmalate dehydratase large subunit
MPAVLGIDLHLIHEVTSPQAFTQLRERGLKVRRPDRTVATMDHSTPTTPRDANGIIPVVDPLARAQLAQLEQNCAEFGIPLHKLGTIGQGIVHVIGPEMGLTQPGMTSARLRHRHERGRARTGDPVPDSVQAKNLCDPRRGAAAGGRNG